MSVSGLWHLNMKTPMGDQLLHLTMVEDAGAITGTLSNNGADEVAIKDGKVAGDQITFKADVKKPFPVTITFTIANSGDTLTGTAKPGMFPGTTLTGVRAG